jgi:hypothetical protein
MASQQFPLARNLMFLKVVILQQTHKDLLIFFENQGVMEFRAGIADGFQGFFMVADAEGRLWYNVKL